jgi:hypothetical protein
VLGGFDVFGTGAFRSATFGVGDALSFTEFVVSYALEAGRVEKQVFAGSRVNKSKALVSESFDSTFSHAFLSFPKKMCLAVKP